MANNNKKYSDLVSELEEGKVDYFEEKLIDEKPIENDSQFIDIRSHTEAYGDILKEYANNLIENNIIKRKNNKAMFIISCILLCTSFLAVIIIPIIIIFDSKATDAYEKIIEFIPTVITFLTSFMVIPKIITNYLFNKDEEKYMTQIITNTQKFDYSLYCKSTDNTTENELKKL